MIIYLKGPHSLEDPMNREMKFYRTDAVWELDLRQRESGGIELIVTDADTGSALAQHSLEPGRPDLVPLMLEQVACLGAPREIRTDNSAEFASRAFVECLRSLGIQHAVLSPLDLPPKARPRKPLE